MGRTSHATQARRENLVRGRAEARARRRVIDPRQLAFSIIVTGSEPGKVQDVFLWNDLELPSQNDLNTAVQEVCRRIKAMARESMDQVKASLDSPTCISFDGSWEHRRNASRCLFTVIQQGTGKVIDSVVISRKVAKDDPTFCSAPNMMESRGLALMINRLRDNENIVAYVHDNDAKARKMIQRSGWQIKEYLDPGHVFKAFERKLQKFNSKNGRILKEIEGSLKKWLRTVVKSSKDADTKAEMWKNCVGHFIGDHQHCHHEPKECKLWSFHNNANAVKLLKEFLESTEFIVRTVSPEFSTQTNESLHLLKARYANKDIRWGPTWDARVMAAVLDRNVPYWKERLYVEMGLPPLSPVNLLKLRREEWERIQRKRLVHSEQYIAVQFAQRKEWRRCMKNAIRSLGPDQAQLAYRPNPYQVYNQGN